MRKRAVEIRWHEILARMEAGESQTRIADALGMTRGQFRYRLRKYLEQQSEMEVYATTSLAEEETEAAKTEAAKELEAGTESVFAPSLFDESWTRTWQMNRLVALAKEPGTIFVYWEVTELRKQLISEHFQCDWLSLPFFLQVYDVTHIHFNGYNANSTRSIPVHPLSDNWYIRGVEPGRNYQVDFGTTTFAGQFFAILRSNVVETSALPGNRTHQPTVRFATLHTAAGWPAVDPHPFVADSSGRQQHSLPIGLSEPWRDQFAGYSLSGQKGGGR
ncbi:DUF4912 domain-containing protein [Effusibacillus pohliae]|uniref:DUF4912 domain-containing protein n=1 Tax=Effusibacillus pohliae TaxID=232270 RepID=UPI00036E7F4D|nr:DUF4912 domain-containing protein [Effusibacillus pohliae]